MAKNKMEMRTRWRLRSSRHINFKSLEDVWLSLFVFIIQIICIYRGWLSLSKYSGQSWQPNPKPVTEIWMYTFMIFMSILMLPLFMVSSLMRIGSYANDNFKVGSDLDVKSLLEKLAHKMALTEHKQRQYANDSVCKKNSPFITSSFISQSNVNSFIKMNTKNTKQNPIKPNKPFVSFMRSLFSTRYFWKHFMPVSCFLHLIIAFCLLYPKLVFTSKEIEYGLRPRGYIHHSEMDFLLNRPLQRFSDSQSYFDSSQFSSYILNIQNETSNEHHNSVEASPHTSTTSIHLNRNQIKLQLISSSLNDIDQINYEPRMSLEFFNFVLALVTLAIRYAATLWPANKLYALILSFHVILFTCLSLISYSSFEVLFKFQSCFRNGIKIKVDLVNHNSSSAATALLPNLIPSGSYQEVLFNLPFVMQPLSLQFTYLSSMFLFLLSSMPIFSYGMYQHKLKFKRLQVNFSRIFKPHSRSIPSEIEMETIAASKSNDSSESNNETCSSGASSSASAQLKTIHHGSGIEYASLNKDGQEEEEEDGELRFDLNQANSKHRKISRIVSPTSDTSDSCNGMAVDSLSMAHSSVSMEQETRDNSMKPTTVQSESPSNRTKVEQLSFYSIYKPFKNHIFALVILLVMCVYSAMLVYDYICLYQLTSDTLPLWSALMHIAFVLWYILLWLVLTFKTKWTFTFSHTFKLNYWNFVSKLDQLNEYHLLGESSTDSSITSSCSSDYSANECVEIILAQNKCNRSKYLSTHAKQILRTKHQQHMPSSCTANTHLTEYNQFTFPASKKRISCSFSNANMSQSLINASNNNINNNTCKGSSSSLANLIHNTNSLRMAALNSQTKLNKLNGSSNLILSGNPRNSAHEVSMSNQYLSSGLDVNGNCSDYENYSHSGSRNFNGTSLNLSNLNKKQPSLRRLNQLIMAESNRLAPVFENTSSTQKQNEITMNNHLLFLRRNMPSSSLNGSSNGYEEPKACDPNNSSIYQSSILAVVNSQLPTDFSNHNDSLNTNNTNDETMALIKKEEDSHLEYDLLTTSIANRLSTQSIKSKASIANYTSINELEKRASAIITHSSSLSQNNNNKNDHRGSFKSKLNEIITTNDMQLNEFSSNLKKLTRTIDCNDSVGQDSSTSFLNGSINNNNNNKNKTTTESSPKSNSSMISELSIPASNSSSSACSIGMAKPSLNVHETDSGRHSMSDSPTQNSQKETKTYLINKNINKSAAGTFTSKVTSSGTAVTLSQTMQNLEKQQSINNQQQQHLFTKKKMTSRSRDNNLMTKSSSFCRVPVTQTAESTINLKNIRSHSSNSRSNENNSNCNSNGNKNNNNSTKCSSLSVNRNCSEL